MLNNGISHIVFLSLIQNVTELQALNKSLVVPQFFNNVVMHDRKDGKKLKISDSPGLLQSIATLCLFNRIAISFSTFWVFRTEIENFINDARNETNLTERARLAYRQQLVIVGFFLEGVLTERVTPQSRKKCLRKCAQHTMKLFHAGLVGQSIFWMTTIKKGQTKLPKVESVTVTNKKSTEQVDTKPKAKRGRPKKGVSSDDFESRLQVVEFKISRLYTAHTKSAGTPGNAMEKQDEDDFKALRTEQTKMETKASSPKGFIANFFENRRAVLQKEIDKSIAEVKQSKNGQVGVLETSNSVRGTKGAESANETDDDNDDSRDMNEKTDREDEKKDDDGKEENVTEKSDIEDDVVIAEWCKKKEKKKHHPKSNTRKRNVVDPSSRKKVKKQK